jgi:hypothetical protein
VLLLLLLGSDHGLHVTVLLFDLKEHLLDLIEERLYLIVAYDHARRALIRVFNNPSDAAYPLCLGFLELEEALDLGVGFRELVIQSGFMGGSVRV